MGWKRRHSTEAISVEADIEGALKQLEGLGASKDKVMRRLLSGIGTAAKAQARKAYRSYGLSKGSGALYRSITRRVIKSGKAVIVEAKAQSEKNKVFYGYALAKGAVITAKDKGYLTFQKDGKWVKVRSVRLAGRDFIAAPVKRYLASPAFGTKLDQLVQRELDRIGKENSK